MLFICKKNTLIFKEVTGFTYKKTMLSTCIWSEAEILELPSRRKIEIKNIYSVVKIVVFSFLECGMNCDTKMPCNAYYFDNGICSLAFLKKELFYNVKEQDEENKSIYLNGNKYC